MATAPKSAAKRARPLAALHPSSPGGLALFPHHPPFQAMYGYANPLAVFMALFPSLTAVFAAGGARPPRRHVTGTRRPPTPIPPIAAPLQDTTCTCTFTDPIRTGDGKARCRRCAGIVRRQGRLDPQPGDRR